MDLDGDLDIFGQQPSMNVYTQLCFCFSVVDASSHSAIINKLTNGLKRLSASFPWIAGQLVNEGSTKGNSGVFKVKALGDIPCLVVKDLRLDDSMPTIDSLRQAKFPGNMLDESIIAPRRTIPGTSDKAESDSEPIFLLQANFITGGLLLTFVGQHNAMDMTGQGHIIELLSKACHDEEFTKEELSAGNASRRNIVPLLDQSYEPGPEITRQIVKTTNKQSKTQLPPQKCTWTYVIFPRTSLNALKSLAMTTKTLAVDYVSTDDTLSAFLWQSISRARLTRLRPQVECTIDRAVDLRRYLNIPQTYPGLMSGMTYHTSTLEKLIKNSLGGIASLLRSAVDPRTSNLGHITRANATYLDRLPDKSDVDITATYNSSTDIMLSSWAQFKFYELDFDLGLGKPEIIRRPQFTPVEGLIYLMPRAPNGEIAIAMCLREVDMERLIADEEFAKYARYVG